jgi:hypothetical protein
MEIENSMKILRKKWAYFLLAILPEKMSKERNCIKSCLRVLIGKTKT